MKKPALQPNDVHVIVNDWEKNSSDVGEAKCYSATGEMLWKIPAICKGINGPSFDIKLGDTPPGLYLAGELTPIEPAEPAFGRYFIDLVDQEKQESSRGRGDIGWHGGGSGAADPFAPLQPLLATHGCIRSYNKDMEAIVVPTLNRVRKMGGKMWITVNQF